MDTNRSLLLSLFLILLSICLVATSIPISFLWLPLVWNVPTGRDAAIYGALAVFLLCLSMAWLLFAAADRLVDMSSRYSHVPVPAPPDRGGHD